MIHQMNKYKNLKENILMIEEKEGNFPGIDREEIDLMKEIMKRAEIELDKDRIIEILVDQEITIKDILNLCTACTTIKWCKCIMGLPTTISLNLEQISHLSFPLTSPTMLHSLEICQLSLKTHLQILWYLLLTSLIRILPNLDQLLNPSNSMDSHTLKMFFRGGKEALKIKDNHKENEW